MVKVQTHSCRNPTLNWKGGKNKEQCRQEVLKGNGQVKRKDGKKEGTQRRDTKNAHNGRALKKQKTKQEINEN